VASVRGGQSSLWVFARHNPLAGTAATGIQVDPERDLVNMIHALRSAQCSFGTDCEYVTKCLWKKSLNNRRCLSYRWRYIEANVTPWSITLILSSVDEAYRDSF
jgi:hypothetical protein